MKKAKLRSIAWTMMAVVSLACYSYLNTFSSEAELTMQMEEEMSDTQDDETTVYLPDIALVKKLLNITKMVIPND